jgi:hypothetical protein
MFKDVVSIRRMETTSTAWTRRRETESATARESSRSTSRKTTSTSTSFFGTASFETFFTVLIKNGTFVFVT